MVVTNTIEPQDKVLRKLWIILNTYKGTIPLFRDIGISFSIVDKPITQIPSLLSQELDVQIKKYIPELKLKNINCFMKNEKTIIKVEVIRND